MIQTNIFQSEDTTRWEPAGAGITRQVMGFGDELMLVKVKFEKGACGVLHSHPHTQASYVESGAFELNIGGTIKILHKGDGYYVPSNVEHGCVCLEEGMLIDAFSPARKDFLAD